MAKTSIEWCDHSVNPFRARNKETGATGHWCCKISAGCKGCYASRLQPRFGTLPFVAENREKVELYLEERVLHEVLRRRKPTRYFWCDMTDMFLEDYPDEWIDQCFAAMALTPWHTHMILTKRAERLLRYSDFRFDNREHAIGSWMRYYKPVDPGLPEMPLPNVRLGVSCEDQQHADERIPLLLQTPAAVRFVSAEPLLGPIDLYRYMPWTDISTPEFGTGLDLVIVGGESGPGARPMNIEWARDIVRQCREANVACFVKQMGTAWAREGQRIMPAGQWDRKGGDPSEWPEDLRVRQFPEVRNA